MIPYKFSFPQNRIIRLCLLILPLVFAVPLCIDLLNSERIIFPTSEFGNRINAYTDRGWKGNSTIDKFNFDNKIFTFGYTLHDASSFPMVFIIFTINSEGFVRDFSAYDHVVVWIRDATMSQVTLFIKTFLPGVSVIDDRSENSYRHNQYTLNINPEIHKYEIPLDEFITDQWWLDMVKRVPESIPTEQFHMVTSFDLQFNRHGSNNMTNKKETISIEKIAFLRNPSMTAVVLFSILCIYELIMIILMFRVQLWRKGSNNQIIPEQKHLEIPNLKKQKIQKINEFLEAHYMDPGISTRVVSSEIGIPPAHIFTLLKESYNLTFKQIINKMRIKEAKRLLRESELRITEIALNLGFNELSYFNRIFKKHVGIAPSEFRKDLP